MNKTLKWIGLLPISILASVLAFVIGSLIGYVSMRMFVFGGDGRWILAISRIVSNVFAGYVFVYVGTLIAPAYKKQTAITLAALILVLLTVSITLQLIFRFVDGFWEQVEVYIGSVFALLGAISAYQSIQKDSEIENK